MRYEKLQAKITAEDNGKHRTLREAGWKVLVVWKCELENNRKKETLRRIENQIRSNGVSQTEVIA